MIQFKTINSNGDSCTWEYENAVDLKIKWRSESCDETVPDNEEPIYDVVIDGKSDLKEATFERIGTDSVWFEDLLTYLGIRIWE